MSVTEKKIPYYLRFSDVIRILRLIDETPFQELLLELGELKVRVVRDQERPGPAEVAGCAAQMPEGDQGPYPEPAPEPTSPPRSRAVSAAELEGTPVTAPLSGVFYRAPYPGEPPFVEVGSAVKAGDVLGILEIMKLMNHVKVPCSGTIIEICAQNGEFVEFGRVLAKIAPEPGTEQASFQGSA